MKSLLIQKPEIFHICLGMRSWSQRNIMLQRNTQETRLVSLGTDQITSHSSAFISMHTISTLSQSQIYQQLHDQSIIYCINHTILPYYKYNNGTEFSAFSSMNFCFITCTVRVVWVALKPEEKPNASWIAEVLLDLCP